MPNAALLVAHSGGPTAVLNASLAGILDEARRHTAIDACYGARFGIEGLIGDDLAELGTLSAEEIERIADQSGSVLGTSRKAVSRVDLERVLAVCRRRGVRFVLYTGGNGSMGTALELSALAREAGQPLAVIGVPKTIDNDLAGTDHSPGYGSAARFFAAAARDIDADNRALRGLVQFIEVLGRHAGWLVAATMLARRGDESGPHLVYCPERRLPLGQLLDDVQRVFDRRQRCVVAVCEGQLDEHGEPFGADVRMSSRGPLATNLAHRLANLVTEHLGIKARGEKPGLLGRVSRELRSSVDWREARLCGQAAVQAALDGESGVMITLDRAPGREYVCTTGRVPLADVANIERTFPEEWIAPNGHDIQPEFADWAGPIVGEVDRYEEL